MGRLALTVDFLEGELLCFADEAEYHAPGDEVQAGVEADCGYVSILRFIEVKMLGGNLQAPTCVMASTIAGKVKLRIPAAKIG